MTNTTIDPERLAQLRGGEPVDTRPAPDDERMWSVTTIIGVLDKPALIYWAADITAQAAVDDLDTVNVMARKNPAAAVEWLKGARFRRPPGQRSASDLGIAVHSACEEYALSGTRPDVDAEVAPFLASFDQWLQIWTPSYQAAEVTVYSPTYGYAGTCDGFMTIDGVPTIFDYKSSRESFDKKGQPRRVYPEIGLQLAAYRYAEMAAIWRPRRFEVFKRRYYLLSEAERALAVPVPKVEGGLGIMITPEHCTAYPVRCDEAVFERFLYVLEAAAFPLEMAQTIVGSPLEGP